MTNSGSEKHRPQDGIQDGCLQDEEGRTDNRQDLLVGSQGGAQGKKGDEHGDPCQRRQYQHHDHAEPTSGGVVLNDSLGERHPQSGGDQDNQVDNVESPEWKSPHGGCGRDAKQQNQENDQLTGGCQEHVDSYGSADYRRHTAPECLHTSRVGEESPDVGTDDPCTAYQVDD